jgi:hypothetical protein
LGQSAGSGRPRAARCAKGRHAPRPSPGEGNRARLPMPSPPKREGMPTFEARGRALRRGSAPRIAPLSRGPTT